MTGHVENIGVVLDKAAVVVAPVDTGGGMRVKVIEALAAGKAVVTSRPGARGLSVADGRELVLAETDDEFAEAIVDLLAALSGARRSGRQGAAGRWRTCHGNAPSTRIPSSTASSSATTRLGNQSRQQALDERQRGDLHPSPTDALARCLRGLAAGTALPAEVVVVDQSRGDETKTVVQAAEQLLPLVYLHHEGTGLGVSQNLGIPRSDTGGRRGRRRRLCAVWRLGGWRRGGVRREPRARPRRWRRLALGPAAPGGRGRLDSHVHASGRVPFARRTLEHRQRQQLRSPAIVVRSNRRLRRAAGPRRARERRTGHGPLLPARPGRRADALSATPRRSSRAETARGTPRPPRGLRLRNGCLLRPLAPRTRRVRP